jgi:hypothetical protein
MTTTPGSSPPSRAVEAQTGLVNVDRPEVAHCYDMDWYLSEPLWRSSTPAPHRFVTALRYNDGTIRVRHHCKVIDGLQLVVAPALQLDGGHRIVQSSPLTVEPSVLCPDCGLHGFIRQGMWVSV